jgi:hypothetical protein
VDDDEFLESRLESSLTYNTPSAIFEEDISFPPPHLHLSLSLIQLYISSLSLLSLLKREKEIRKTT